MKTQNDHGHRRHRRRQRPGARSLLVRLRPVRRVEVGIGRRNITLTVATFNEFGYDDLYQEYMDSHPGIKVVEKKAATSNEDPRQHEHPPGRGFRPLRHRAIEVDWLPELAQYPDEFTDLTSDETNGRWLDWKTEAATVDGKLIGYGTDIGPEGHLLPRRLLPEKAGLPTDRDEVASLLDGGWDKYFEVGKDFVSKTDIPGTTGPRPPTRA